VARRGKLAGPDESQDLSDGQQTSRRAITASVILFIIFLAVLLGSSAAIKVFPYEYDTHLLFVFQVRACSA
jgi:hypothetical protein